MVILWEWVGGGGILVVLLGLFAGYNSVSGFLANTKRSVQ